MLAFARCMRGAGRPKSYTDKGISQLKSYNANLTKFMDKLKAAGFNGVGAEIERKRRDEGVEEEVEREKEVEGLALRIRRLEWERDELHNDLKEAHEMLAANEKMIQSLKAHCSPHATPARTGGAGARPKTAATGATFGVFRTPEDVVGEVIEESRRESARSGVGSGFPPLSGSHHGSATARGPTLGRSSAGRVSMGPTAGFGRTPPSPPPPHSGLTTAAKVRMVSDSMRVIKQMLGPEADVVEHLLEAERLKSSILDYFREESEEVQCLVAKAHLSGGLKSTGDAVSRQMERTRCFSLDGFFEEVFQLTFPSAYSSLDIGFRKLSQSYPNPTTIVEYSRRFETFVTKLGLSLKSNYLKFIEGLTNADVRSSLVRYPYHDMEFQELVTYAVGVQNSLSVQMKEKVKVFACEEGEEFEEEGVYKVFGRPFKAYEEALRQKNLKGHVCWNCFNPSHMSSECRTKSCKFCHEPITKVRHLSLLCPKAPRDLGRFSQPEGRFSQPGKREQNWGRRDQGVKSALVNEECEAEIVNIE